MKKIRIRRIIVRETETTIIKPGDAEKDGREIEPHVCPLCHSLIQPKQISTRLDRKLLTEKKKDS